MSDHLSAGIAAVADGRPVSVQQLAALIGVSRRRISKWRQETDGLAPDDPLRAPANTDPHAWLAWLRVATTARGKLRVDCARHLHDQLRVAAGTRQGLASPAPPAPTPARTPPATPAAAPATPAAAPDAPASTPAPAPAPGGVQASIDLQEHEQWIRKLWPDAAPSTWMDVANRARAAKEYEQALTASMKRQAEERRLVPAGDLTVLAQVLARETVALLGDIPVRLRRDLDMLSSDHRAAVVAALDAQLLRFRHDLATIASARAADILQGQ